MFINFNHLKTFCNAITQKMKGFRGNWNQNDSTADDHIKNRPFYSENGEAIILKETQLTFDGGYSVIEAPVTLEAGKTYKITYNGITYECVAVNSASLERSTLGVMPLAAAVTEIVIGNFALLMGAGDTGEPFCMINYPGEALVVLDVNGAESATVDIKEDVEIVHKLDKKFIDMPDGIITEDNLYDNLENNLAPVAFTNNYDSLSGKPTIYTDVVRYGNSQSLSSSQKLTAKGNINAVGYDTQTLTDAQKLQARNNIGAGTSDFSGNYFDLENKPCAKTILADEVILVDYAVPFDEYVYGRALGKAPLEPTSDYKYRVIIGETTYYPSVTRYSSGSALGNKSLINSTITPEDSGEPFFFTFLPNATHTFNVEIYYDENVLNTPANVQVIQEMKVEYSLLEDGYIPDTIARTTDIITTCTYSWDGDVTGKESFVIPVNNVDSVPTVTYYKISDKYFNVADIVSSEVLAASLTTDTSIHEEGFYCSEGVLVADAAGYNTSIGPSSSFPAYIPSPGIYFYTYLPPSSGEQRKGIESATITYKAPMLSSAVVGITRTINGVSPDVEGNIEIPTPVQPNLEQNDETAPDYIKNRTHYEEISRGVSKTFDCAVIDRRIGNDFTTYELGSEPFTVEFVNVIKTNNLFEVIFNGVEYICSVIYEPDSVTWLIGNTSLLSGTMLSPSLVDGFLSIAESKNLLVDTGEPFCIVWHDSINTIGAMYAFESGTYNVTVTPMERIVHKLDKKFLPDDHINSLIDAKLGVIENGSY